MMKCSEVAERLGISRTSAYEVIPGRMTKAERTGAEVLDRFFPDTQFTSVVHASAKVCEGSWQWTPVASFEPGSRPARDYAALAEEVLHELG